MFKRVFLTLAAIASLAVSASAQGLGAGIVIPDDEEVLKPYAISVGPKVGANVAFAGNPEGMKIDMAGGVGFFGGVAANVRFGRPVGRPFGTERFGVQLEALYSMRTLNNNVDNITRSCLEIPVLFQWYFVPNFAVEVGPTFACAMATSPKHFKYKNDTYPLDVNSADVMLTLGVNCKLRNGFTADLRYNLGTSNLTNSFQTKVSTLTLGVGWLFTVSK